MTREGQPGGGRSNPEEHAMTTEPNDRPAIDTPDYQPEPAGRVDAVVAAVHGAATTARGSVGDAYGVTRDAVADGYAVARDKVSATYGDISERLSPALGVARESVGHAYDAAREQSAAVLGNARDTLSQAREKTVQNIEDNPLAAIVGGIALGAAVGALLPGSRREAALLAPVGGKLNDAARGAFEAAKAAGLAKLDELGLNRDVARDTVQKFVANAGEAARSAGEAAAASVRESKD